MAAPGLEALPRPSVGLAYSGLVRNFIERHEHEVDHVEIPFELLRHDPGTLAVRERFPVILHCASLSIAGTQRCNEGTLCEIAGWVEQTRTPWVGEHLAFITASRTEAGAHPEEYAPGEPYNIGYTVSPVMDERTVARVVAALSSYSRRFAVPILIENSPLYFRAPGSVMSQTEFIKAICDRIDTDLLLDLSHFAITARSIGFDPFAEIERLPLDRVVELHLSGIDDQLDGSWDDHASAAPEIVHELLAQVLKTASPRAITLEYNWSSRFPEALLLEELARVRDAI
jgi:uncharacterized protein